MTFKGLSEKEVLELRKKFGENVISVKEEAPWLSILLSQLKSPLIYIVFLVGLISLLFQKYTDAVLILFVIILNTLMGFFQEFRAHQTLVALNKILKPKTVVLREGQRKQITAAELVPQDLVLLSSGDRVPADGKLIEGVNLLVNEAILTGEEEAVEKTTVEGKNLLFMGATILAGRGIMLTEKTGTATTIGRLEQSLVEIKKEKTPLQIKLAELSKSLAKLVLILSLFIFLTGLFHQSNIWEVFRFSIILAVAAIPEGLPVAITVILTLGMRKILKKQGLVKRLISIETLGATSVICTDKTGTLTEGKMQVVRTDFVDKKKALVALTLTNEQKTNVEVAIWNYLREEGFSPQAFFDKFLRIYEEPFDSEKKYMITVNEIEGERMGFVLGAPEIILSFCRISNKEQKNISDKTESWADEGLKILGLAFKKNGDPKAKSGFSWLGLIAIQDPIRKEVKEAISKAREAGISVKIVTGDYRKTAERIALNLGFKLGPGSILEGQELEAISEEELKNRIDDISLFTRVTPHQKQKIVKVLQEKKEVVAMTGDGVNDALALKKADIGVVVGSEPAEVAKEAGDLILLDSNFKTIVAAVEEGRTIFSNIKKVVSYVLSNSFVEIFLILGSLLLKLPYPLTIAQILWIHLICDGPPDIILGFEPKEKDIMKERPENLQKESILPGSMKFLIFAISLTVGLLCLIFFWYILKINGDLNLARTVTFATVASVDLIYIFSFRNLRKPIFKIDNFFQNKFLFLGVAYGFLLTLAVIYLPALNRLLGTQPLKPIFWLLVLAVSLITILWAELVKFFWRPKSRFN